MASPPRPAARRLLLAACAVAVIHAAPSLYWALGGRALVGTLGAWAVDWQREQPVVAALVLLLVGAVKVAGGVVPVLNSTARLPFSRLWRGLSVAGAAVLVLYGGANTVVGGAALLGLVGEASSTDRTALMGHVFLWDPLFLLWGLLLGGGLWADRHRSGAAAPQLDRPGAGRGSAGAGPRPRPRR